MGAMYMLRRGRVFACGLVVLLSTSCIARGPIEREADALGLAGAERRRFEREVDACIRQRGHEAGPASTVSVSGHGGADADSGVGLAAIGVAAAVVTAGVVYHAMGEDDRAVGDEQSRADQEGVAESDAADPFVDVCVRAVSERWSSERR